MSGETVVSVNRVDCGRDVRRLDAEGQHRRELAPYARQYSWDDVWETGLALFLEGLEERLRR